MAYKIAMSFYEGNLLFEYGNEFKSDDQDRIKELLEDGNIVEVDDSEIESTPVVDSAPVEPVTEGEANSTTPLVEAPVEEVVSEPTSVEPVPEPVVVPVEQPTASQIQEDIASVESSNGTSIEIQ